MKTFREFLMERSYGAVDFSGFDKEFIIYFKGNDAEELTYAINSEDDWDEDDWVYNEDDKTITVYTKKAKTVINKLIKDNKLKVNIKKLDFKLS